jgi:aspartate carbamoyltransferase catalytic subunit
MNTPRHIISSNQFDIEYIQNIINLTAEIKNNPEKFSQELKGKVGATLFYEPSTRTRFSFESALHRLGASVIMTENGGEFSSVSKGETIEDSVKVIANYSDVIIMRHKDDDSSERAAQASPVPIINAGSGKTQHPTQALLDVCTIFENFNRLENLKIAVVGDLLRGRTCDSLVQLLSLYQGNKFYFVSPENSRIKNKLRDELLKNNIDFIETEDLNSVLSEVDVLYMTRIQKERFDTEDEYLKAKGKIILNKENLRLLKENAIIMHPLPRIDEITVDVDKDPRAKYFEQAGNGLWARMAILVAIFRNK